MRYRLDLTGDRAIAGKWVGYAKARLRNILRILSTSPKRIFNEQIPLPGVKIFIDVANGLSHIRIAADNPKDMIITAWVGPWTNDFIKKYFDLDGKELTEAQVKARGWKITDDGKYYQVLPSPDPGYDDPDSYTYLFDGGGAGIPVGSDNIGRDNKLQSGKNVRILFGTVGEFTLTTGFVESPTWMYLMRQDSLIFFSYNQMFSRHAVTRYSVKEVDGVVEKSAIYMFSGLGGVGADGVAIQNAQLGGFWLDEVGIVKRIYKKNLETGVKEYVTIPPTSGYTKAGCFASCKDYPDLREEQEILRVNHKDLGGGVFTSEPSYVEKYSLDGTVEAIDTIQRCTPPGSDTCGYFSGSTISGGPDYHPVSGMMVDSYLTTIANSAKITVDIKHDGSMTYLLIEKQTQLALVKQSVYCADELVETSGWQSVQKLLMDGDSIPGDYMGPKYVFPTRYRIVTSHHGKEFDAVFYRKTVFVETSSAYETGYRATNSRIGADGLLRRNRVQSRTTWHLSVNGTIHDLTGYEFVSNEYAFSVESIPTVVGTHVGFSGLPWVDTVGAGNVNLSRPFTSESDGHFLFVVDVYPKTIVHTVATDGGNLAQKYSVAGSGQPFPCSDDYAPENIADRVQMLFDTSGSKIKDIPNFINSSTGLMHKRVNAISLLRG